MTLRTLVAVFIITTLGLVPGRTISLVLAQSAPDPALSPVNASNSPYSYQGETSIATSGSTLVGIQNDLYPVCDPNAISGSQGDCSVSVETSADGGKTWTRPKKLLRTWQGHTYRAAADPSIVFDGSRFIAVYEVADQGGGSLAGRARFLTAVVAATSTDGVNWNYPSTPVDVSSPTYLNDRPRVAVDTSSGPYRGRVYVAWTEVVYNSATDTTPANSHIMSAYSLDSALHWSRPIQVDDGILPSNRVEPFPAVDPSTGVAYMSWFDSRTGYLGIGSHHGIYVSKSYNGGGSWLANSQIVQTTISGDQSISCNDGLGVGPSHSLLVAADGTVYLIYADDTTYDGLDIFAVRSTRTGWSDPFRVNDDPYVVSGGQKHEQYNPTATLDPSTGKVTVAFYDRRLDNQNCKTNLYSAQAADGIHYGRNTLLTYDSGGSSRYDGGLGSGPGDYTGSVFVPGSRGGNYVLFTRDVDPTGRVPGGGYESYVTRIPPPPTVTSVSPGNGPATGGNSVTITGTNFTGSPDIRFGSSHVPAALLTVNSDTHITAVSPAGTAGTVDVTVTTPGGTSATTSADKFTWTQLSDIRWGAPTIAQSSTGFVSNQLPRLAIDPSDSVYVSWQGSDASANLTRSSDGGASFASPVAAVPAYLADWGHDILAGPDNHIYLAWCDSTGPDQMRLQFIRSADGGQSFDTPIALDDRTGICYNGNTQPRIARSSDGTIYVVWGYVTASFQHKIYIAKSTDAGATFSPALAVQPDDPLGEMDPSVAAGPGGMVYVTWQTNLSPTTSQLGNTYVSRSSDGGATFGPAIRLNSVDGLTGTPAVAAYGSHVYVTWADGRPDGTGIYLAQSSDDGATFSFEAKINDNANAAGQGPPAIATGPTGQVLIAWADTRNATWPCEGDIYSALSTDNGNSFGANSRVNPNVCSAVTDGFGDVDAGFTSTGVPTVVWLDSNWDVVLSRGT